MELVKKYLYYILPVFSFVCFAPFTAIFILWCVGKYRLKKMEKLENNADATNEDRQHHKRPVWILWTLAIMTVIGLAIVLTLLFIGAPILKGRRLDTSIGSLPQLDYNGSIWSEDYSFDEDIDISEAVYRPSTQLQKHVLDVAKNWTHSDSDMLQGQTTLWVPALRCQNANDSVISNATRRFGRDVSHKDIFFTSYAAWVPGDQFASQWLPALQGDPFPAPNKTIDDQSPDTKRIFVMTNSGDIHKVIDDGVYGPLGSVNVTECRLGNASLTVDFDNDSAKVANWTLPFTHDELTETTANELASYTALMNAFDAILIGDLKVYGPAEPSIFLPFSPPWRELDIDWTRAEKVQRGLESFFQNITISLLSDPSFSKAVTLY